VLFCQEVTAPFHQEVTALLHQEVTALFHQEATALFCQRGDRDISPSKVTVSFHHLCDTTAIFAMPPPFSGLRCFHRFVELTTDPNVKRLSVDHINRRPHHPAPLAVVKCFSALFEERATFWNQDGRSRKFGGAA